MELQNMKKKRILKETWSSYDQKFACSDNPGQNIWNKIEKSCKIGYYKKGLISAFVCFLTAIAKVSILERRLSTRLSLHCNLRFF